MDDVVKRLEAAMLPEAEPFAGKGARPVMPTRGSKPAPEGDIAPIELVQAMGNLPVRTVIAFRDAARDTNAITEWERCEAALHRCVGSP